MRKVILSYTIVLMLTIFLCACAFNGDTNSALSLSSRMDSEFSKELFSSSVPFEEYIYFDEKEHFIFPQAEYGKEYMLEEFELDSLGVTIQKTPINTKEQAQIVGEKIITECHQKNHFTDQWIYCITHYTVENVWVLSYGLDQRGIPLEEQWLDENSIHIAVNGNTGEFIKTWYEWGG